MRFARSPSRLFIPAHCAGRWKPRKQIAEPHKLSVRADSRLMELNAGVFQDRLRSELAETYPPELMRWLGGDEDFAIPGGESRRQLAERGCEALRSIAAAGYCEVVV